MMMSGSVSLNSRDSAIKKILSVVKTERDAIALRPKFASIFRIESTEGVVKAQMFIMSNVKYITDVLGIQMNDAQVQDCLDEFSGIRWFTLADFKCLLEYAKKQKFYQRDYKAFIDTVHAYVDSSLDTAEGDSYQKHLDVKSSEQMFARASKTETINQIFHADNESR